MAVPVGPVGRGVAASPRERLAGEIAVVTVLVAELDGVALWPVRLLLRSRPGSPNGRVGIQSRASVAAVPADRNRHHGGTVIEEQPVVVHGVVSNSCHHRG